MKLARLLAALLLVAAGAAACGSSPTLPETAPSAEAARMESPTFGGGGF